MFCKIPLFFFNKSVHFDKRYGQISSHTMLVVYYRNISQLVRSAKWQGILIAKFGASYYTLFRENALKRLPQLSVHDVYVFGYLKI